MIFQQKTETSIWHTFSIFTPSTFVDMQAECNHLKAFFRKAGKRTGRDVVITKNIDLMFELLREI